MHTAYARGVPRIPPPVRLSRLRTWPWQIEESGRWARSGMSTSNRNMPQADAGIAGTPTDHQFVFADANGRMKHWPVPESFEFPKDATLFDGWRVWLVGGVHYDDGKAWKVKPYRELKGGDMKTKAMKEDLKHWRGIYSLMESAVTLPSDKAEITQEVVLSTLSTRLYHAPDKVQLHLCGIQRRQAREAQGWNLVSKDEVQRGSQERD